MEEVNILRVSEQGFILKKGEKCDKAFIIIEGTASVYVHVGKEDIKEKFSNLNTGSCFNVFSFLNPDGIQLTSFIADDFCVLLTISRKQIEELENRFYQLQDELMKVRINIISERVCDFDFFRYCEPNNDPEH